MTACQRDQSTARHAPPRVYGRHSVVFHCRARSNPSPHFRTIRKFSPLTRCFHVPPKASPSGTPRGGRGLSSRRPHLRLCIFDRLVGEPVASTTTPSPAMKSSAFWGERHALALKFDEAGHESCASGGGKRHPPPPQLMFSMPPGSTLLAAHSIPGNRR